MPLLCSRPLAADKKHSSSKQCQAVLTYCGPAEKLHHVPLTASARTLCDGAWAHLAAAAAAVAAAAAAASAALAWCPKSEKSCQRAEDLPSLQPSTLAADKAARVTPRWCRATRQTC
jgi:hypothetical protein